MEGHQIHQMKRLVILLLIALVVCVGVNSANGQKPSFQKIINNIRAKSCNLVGLDGVSKCKDMLKVGANGEKNIRDQIKAGIGFGRYTHEVMLPVLKSKQGQDGIVAGGVLNSEFIKQMKSPREFYEMMYPSATNKDNSKIYNGLYARSAGIIFDSYFAGSLTITSAQKQFFTHYVESEDVVTDEFQQIIDLLPDAFDQDVYNLVLTYFGDVVMTKVSYGGVVDQTTLIKECYTDPKMMDYIKSQLNSLINNKTDTPPNGFINYRKVEQVDIAGGNPELSLVQKRIASFAENPVPVQFDVKPIYQVFPTGTKRENMKKVYDALVQQQSIIVNDILKKIEDNKRVEFLKGQTIYIYDVQTSLCKNPIVFFNNCPHQKLCRTACANKFESSILSPNGVKEIERYNIHICGSSVTRDIINGEFTSNPIKHDKDEYVLHPRLESDETPKDNTITDFLDRFGIIDINNNARSVLMNKTRSSSPGNHVRKGTSCPAGYVALEKFRNADGAFGVRVNIYNANGSVWKTYFQTQMLNYGCVDVPYKKVMLLDPFVSWSDDNLKFTACAMCTPAVSGGNNLSCNCPTF